jgi:hypothetical protein
MALAIDVEFSSEVRCGFFVDPSADRTQSVSEACFSLSLHLAEALGKLRRNLVSVPSHGSARREQPITTTAVIGSLATLEETLSVTLTHGNGFDLPNSTCLGEN